MSDDPAPRSAQTALLRRLVEALGDRVFELDDTLLVRDVYQGGVAEPFRSANEAMIGKRLSEILPWPMSEVLEINCLEARRSGEVRTLDYNLSHLGMPEHHREARIAAVDGGILLLIRDISERRAMERRLHQRQTLLQEVEAMAGVGGWSIASDGDFLWTEQLASIHGVVFDDASIGALIECYEGEHRKRLFEAILRAVDHGEPFDLELPIRLAGGEGRWVRVLGRAQRSGKNAWRLQGATQDITARKVFEGQLIEAREAALVASRAKSQFLANASHEIRTPLAGVLGMTALALAGEVPAETRRHLEGAHASGVTLMRLLEDLLDHARIEAGQLRLEVEPLAAAEVLRQAVAAVATEAAGRGLSLALRVDAAVPPWLRGDAVRLRQIALNLLSNAVKFTERGGVEVAALWQDERLVVEVSDTGVGVPEAMLEAIFEPFTQVDGSTTRRHGGAGLGLAISLDLARLMGGTLSARRRPRGGMVFALSLPLPRVDAGPAPLPSPDLTPLPQQRLKTLVAEDNPINVAFISGLLRRLDHDITVASTGRRAVELALAQPFDLILMDVQMPLMDGLEATRRIRAAQGPEGPRPAIVALTASALPGEAQRCKEAGMDDFLEKPLRFERLAEVLRSILGPRPSPAVLVGPSPRPAT